MVDLTTLTLFPFFPRRVGIPSFTIHSEDQFDRYIQRYNGTKVGCHVSIYDCNNTPVIDKIVFDFDGGKRGEKLDEVFDEVRNFVGELISRKFVFVPVFSGNRGFHIYILLRPLEVESSIARFLLRMVQNEFASDYKYIDKQKIGVVNAMIRVPNTLNVKGGRKLWCCYLPTYFMDWKLSEVLEFARSPQLVQYKFNGQRYPLITDLADITVENVDEVRIVEDFDSRLVKVPPIHLIEHLVRPCVYRSITSNPEPPHFVRLDFVAELRHLGYTPQQVFEICKQLNWRDFDPEITINQIRDIFERKLLPPSCKVLRKFVNCQRCGWKYFWIE